MILNILLLCGTMLPAAGDTQPIHVYDLTYTLEYDLSDEAQTNLAWDECHAVATLQGLVNRDAPRLYLLYVNSLGPNTDLFWLNRLSEEGQWLAGRPQVRIEGGLEKLIEQFRDDIKGAIVYDGRVAATSNLASTLAGVHNAIAVRYDTRPGSIYQRLIAGGPQLPVIEKLMAGDGGPLFTGQGNIPGTDRSSTGSTKCDAYLWLKCHYIDTGKVNATCVGHYIDYYWTRYPKESYPNQHTLTNHDYFVANKGWFFDLSPWDDEAPVDDPEQKLGTDLETLKSMLLSAYNGGGDQKMIHIGGFVPWMWKYNRHGKAGGCHDTVMTEWRLVEVITAYNAYIDADALQFAAMANASFYQHFPLKERYPQKWVTHEELKERGYLTADGKVNFDGRKFFLFYVGDYDASAWTYQWTTNAWNHPNRGDIPLNWCISPIIERRAPMVLDYMRQTATENDYFSAPDNGAGYLMPAGLEEPRAISGLPGGLNAWAEHCAPLYKRWDLTVTAFIIDGHSPGMSSAGFDCYARFSPNGLGPQKCPPSLLHGEMPILRASYDLRHSPTESARIIDERARKRTIPFQQFRNILKTPDYYVAVVEELKKINPKLELLDAPTFFELYKIWLQNHPEAAAGRVASPY